jgi:UDP-GlcNAc:undecaprenyl-phosphate GlcNAc-1-phosphate transferase
MTYLLLFATSAAITLALTPVMRDFFRRMGWVDRPDSGRKLHAVPIPRVGGFPISIAFFSSLLILKYLHASLAAVFRQHDAEIHKILLPSLLILAIGAWDDIKGASPYAKIVVQAAAGYWLYAQGVAISHIGVPGTMGIKLGILALPITLLWVVGITNALNLVDGLDGLASGVAFFAATTMFVVAILQRNIPLALLTAALSGSTLAFLRFNFNPATVFLGDSGSMFLGFLLASFALMWSGKASTLVAVVAPLFALGLPIAEVGISVFRRFVRGQPIFAADREHIHHRLLGQGNNTKRTVLTLYGVCALLGIASLLLANIQTRDTGLILLVLVASGWLGIQQLGYHEFGEVGDSLRRGLFQQRRVINMHVRLRNLEIVFAPVKQWTDLLEILRDLGNEFGFHEVTLDLTGRALPPQIQSPVVLKCSSAEVPPDTRQWRLDIPIGGPFGAAPGDQSRIILSRPVSEVATNYMVSVLVQALSESLPPTLDRLLQVSEATPSEAVNR